MQVLIPFGSEIARRLPHYRGEYAPFHPKFPEGSAAVCVKLDGPPNTANIQNIVYTPEDNVAIEAYVRQMVETTWHSVRLVRSRSYVAPPDIGYQGRNCFDEAKGRAGLRRWSSERLRHSKPKSCR
jgi:hypothetical protein